jgi:Na+-transporting NADH:ubiquinone oxidoreductase subunit NqrB
MKPTEDSTAKPGLFATANNGYQKLTSLIKDARDFQIGYLLIFLLYGILFLAWDADLSKYIVICAACLITQAVGIRFTTRNYRGLKSAMITALGLCLLLKANSYETLVLASVLSIASKFLIRSKGKHIFNPNNFGLVLVLLLFPNDAWISPGQWGSDAMLAYFFTGAALIMLLRVGRLSTTIGFLGMLFILEYCRTVLYQGWPMDALMLKFSNGSLLLFAFFMITDPVTTPRTVKGRLLWSACVGILTFVLTGWFYLHTAPIWALFIFAPATLLVNKIFKGKAFSWDDPVPVLKAMTSYVIPDKSRSKAPGITELDGAIQYAPLDLDAETTS